MPAIFENLQRSLPRSRRTLSSLPASSVGPLLQATRFIPIVFAVVPDPVGSGFVSSLARPGGNATGFMNFEYSLSTKWLELLKQIAPGCDAGCGSWDPAIPAGIGQFAVIQSVVPSVGVELSPINVSDADEMLTPRVPAMVAVSS